MKHTISYLFVGTLLFGSLASCSLPTPPGAPAAATQATEPIATSQPSNQIIADATLMPSRSVELAFRTSGSVANIFVAEGDMVTEGEPLAQLDARDQELQVAQQKANLAQAQASYDAIIAGATAQQIAAQQAGLRNAQAQLERVRTGNVTSADIDTAKAQLRAAQAQLDALRNPTPANLSTAQLNLSQAENNLTAVRTNASAAKTTAELAMQQAADTLTQAQASYATAKVNWEYVQQTGADPTNPTSTDQATGKRKTNKLNDVQQRQYYEAFIQAEAAVRSAEKALSQANVAYEQAKQDEITQIQQAEATLLNAQQQFAALKNPTKADLAQAQAGVQQAQATLQKLQQGGTSADLAAAQAAVDQAQASLEQLTTTPRTVDLAAAKARISAAQAALAQAEYALAQTILHAPFAGIIAERHLEVGQQINSVATLGTAAFVLADTSAWNIKTDNLGERDVVRLTLGVPAQITFEALPEVNLAGTISAIQPRGIDRYGDMTYTVTITPSTLDQRLRWGMSASVIITVQQ